MPNLNSVSFGAPVAPLGAITFPDGELSVRNAYLFSAIEMEAAEVEFNDRNLHRGEHQIDVIAVGEFRPGNLGGRTVKFSEEQLQGYIDNTLAAIASTRDAAGVIQGLPIDCYGHDPDSGAAGYIVDVALGHNDFGPVVLATVDWTKSGVEIVLEGKFKWFSGSIDTGNQVLQGGTLTNWPAMRNEAGEILLRPALMSSEPNRSILFAQGDRVISGMSFEERSVLIRDRLYFDFDVFAREVFEELVIAADMDGDHFSIPYSWDEEDAPVFSPRGEWTAVRSTWVEASSQPAKKSFVTDGISTLTNLLRGVLKLDGEKPFPQGGSLGKASANLSAQSSSTGGTNMPENLFANLSVDEQAAMRVQALATIIPRSDGESDDAYSLRLAQFGEIANASAAGISDVPDMVETLVAARVANIQNEITQRSSAQLIEAHRAGRVLEMSTTFSNGSVGNQALPVKAADLQEFLGSLNPKQLEAAGVIFTGILTAGLVPFETIGVDGENDLVKQDLPGGMRGPLTKWLAAGNSMGEFFEINSDLLLDPEQYELGDFVEVEV